MLFSLRRPLTSCAGECQLTSKTAAHLKTCHWQTPEKNNLLITHLFHSQSPKKDVMSYMTFTGGSRLFEIQIPSNFIRINRAILQCRDRSAISAGLRIKREFGLDLSIRINQDPPVLALCSLSCIQTCLRWTIYPVEGELSLSLQSPQMFNYL